MTLDFSPMPVADQAQTEFNGSMGARYIGDRSEGQSFIAGKDGFLEGIEVGFSGFLGGDFEVAIYEQSSIKPSAVNQWVLQVYPNKLGSLVLKNDNIDGNVNRYTSYFDVSSLGIPQAKGSEYFFSITPKGSDIPDPYGMNTFVQTDSSIPDPYPAGSRMTSHDGSTYYLYPDYDLYFKTYVSEEQRNRAPTSIDLTAISFDENIPAGSVVSTLITIDADEDDFFSYSFVAGDGASDNFLFTIEDDKLKFLDSPNYETKSTYSIRVQTTDSGGLTYEAPLTLSVTDLEEDNDIANYSPNREWTQLLGTPTSDYGFSVDTSEDGSVYMAGYTKGNLDGQSNSGNFDVFLSKYSHDGLKVWTRLIGNSNFQTAHSVSVDANGAAYVTGYTSGNLHGQSNSGSNDVFLSKYNSDGSREWTKLIGSTSVDWGHSVSTADDGSVYVAGSTAGNLDGQTNSGGIDAFLSKYNSDGSKEWTEILGSSSQVWVHSVSTTQDDAIYIAGDTRGNLDGKNVNGERDAFLSKYDSNGTRLWTQLLGTSSDDYGYSVSAAEDGSIYLAGATGGDLEGEIHSGGYSDAFLSKYNSDGSREWTQLLGSSQSEHVRSVSTSSDGSIYIAGITSGDLDGQTHKGEGDAFLSKYTSDGIKKWTQLLGSSRHDAGRSVSTFVDGSVYIAGYTQGDLDGQVNSGDMDAFLSKYRFNEPPLDFGISALSFAENLPSGSVVGVFGATDPDVGDTFAYSFVDGAGDSDNALFVIDGDQLKIIDVPDFEVMPSYSIRVQKNDSDGQTIERIFKLSVNDLPEPTTQNIDLWVSAGSFEAPYYRFYTDAEGSQELTEQGLDTSKSYTFRRLKEATSHPFYISDTGFKQSSSAALLITGDGSPFQGITGNESFKIEFTDLAETTEELLYYCSSHSSMQRTLDLIDGSTQTFQVTDVRQIASGLALKLTEAPDLEKLNLYDGADASIDLPDLQLTRSNGTVVDDLSLHWEEESNELYVIQTDSLTGISKNQFSAGESPFQSDLLAEGDYTLIIDARSDGLISASSGELIDGNGDGITGDAFSYSFTKKTPTNVISIGDTTRGSGQSLGLNGIAHSNGINGLPVLVSTTAVIRSISGNVSYDATAFDNASLVVGHDLPDDWVFETQEDVVGSMNYTASGTTAITGTDQELFRFDAVVSEDAAYGSSTLIEATIETPSDPDLNFESDPSLVVLAYSGDTTGNGGHSSLDASRIQRVVVGLDSGFDAFDTLAPTLIGDTTGNGGLSSLDASRVQQEVVGLPVESFPSIPNN